MKLQAGKIEMIYENGFLRYLCSGNAELLRMIYFAVRDKDWNTIPSEIVNESIKIDTNSFTISYDRIFNEGDIRMRWQVLIEGRENSGIFFEARGKALHRFLKNRAGLCILHPVKENAGRPVIITHTDGGMEEQVFPVHISPHQPFKDISAMQWFPLPGSVANLHFAGDIFETEDQRNWTDHSFKTYCTPLDLPFPAMMEEGDEVFQSCSFSFSADRIVPAIAPPDNEVTYDDDDLVPIPPVGLGRSAVRTENYLEVLKDLSRIGFSHYRVDIRLAEVDWQKTLQEVLLESRCLDAPLEIALFLNGGKTEEFEKFLDAEIAESDLSSIILLQDNVACINQHSVDAILPLIRQRFPGILIGCGTDGHFAALNRSDIGTGDFDFVSYSMHPQAHAFDHATLIENTEGQGETVLSARHRFATRVHVSRVMLHERDKIDPRQQKQFGAVWTMASLKYLVEAGAASLTYFEALGDKGICSYENGLRPFPLLGIFEELLSGNWTHVIKSKTKNPLKATSLILSNQKQKKIIIASHSKDYTGFVIVKNSGREF